MTRFPDPLQLPESVPQARAMRKQEVIRAVILGTSIRGAIIVIELIGVVLFQSSAILLDAMASTVDIITSLFLMFSVFLAARPPDEDHPFGHGRYEPLAGLQLGLMMILLGSAMVFQQLFKLTQEAPGVIDPRAWMIPFGAVILLEFSYHIVMYVAKKQDSPALAADALHYRIDAVTSVFATLALLAGVYFPEWSIKIDHFGAILIAGLMVGIGVYAARNNLNQLMDRVPKGRYFNLVKQASMNVPGVLGTEKVRIQLYGPDAHVDIDIEVEPQLPVCLAHEISQKVRREIQKEWPAVRDVTVHIEPYYPGDH